jgi:Putative transposase
VIRNPQDPGEQAVLDYLARYVFRVAITNTRIIGVDDPVRIISLLYPLSSRLQHLQIG